MTFVMGDNGTHLFASILSLASLVEKLMELTASVVPPSTVLRHQFSPRHHNI